MSYYVILTDTHDFLSNDQADIYARGGVALMVQQYGKLQAIKAGVAGSAGKENIHFFADQTMQVYCYTIAMSVYPELEQILEQTPA